MRMMRSYRLQESIVSKDEYNFESLSYIDIGAIPLFLVTGTGESSEKLTEYYLQYIAHTPYKKIKAGQYLSDGVNRFKVNFVDPSPRLSVLYLKLVESNEVRY